MSEDLRELLPRLKAFFPPADYRERALPGGGRWFFIPWQKVKERLDEVFPEWECLYSDPVIVGDAVVVRCKLTIAGVTREAIGNSAAGIDKFGTPVEKAIADAFKNAAELFGVAAHLDDQEALVRYLHSKGDQRGAKFYRENDYIAHGAMGRKKALKTEVESASVSPSGAGLISREEWERRKQRQTD